MVHQPKNAPFAWRPTPPSFFRPYLISCQVCQHDNSKGSSHDLLYHRPVTPVRPFFSTLFFYVRSSGQGSLGKMLWEPTLIKSLFYKPLWACLPSYNNAAYTSKSSIFISTSLPGLSVMCWHHIVEQMLSGGIYSFDCFVSCLTTCGPLCPPPPYSQTSPNTCMALKEQFDLSPCVVIGGPGLVIHGPFDCWHVKCSVPIPKAESWFARSFRFQLFDLRPGSYYWLLMYLQAAKRLPLAHLAAAC